MKNHGKGLFSYAPGELPDLEGEAAQANRAFMCLCEPVEGGWRASCEETGLSAFGRTAEAAGAKLNKLNAERRAKS